MHLQNTLEIPHPVQSDPRPIAPERIQDVAIILALAAASIAFAPLLHALSPALAIGTLTLTACAIVAAVPSCAPAIAIFVLLFQNLFVSISSPYIADPSALDFIKGYNFLNCSVMWLATFALYVTRRRDHSHQINRLLIASTCV